MPGINRDKTLRFWITNWLDCSCLSLQCQLGAVQKRYSPSPLDIWLNATTTSSQITVCIDSRFLFLNFICKFNVYMVIKNGLVVTNDLHILHAWPIKCAVQIKLPSTHTIKTRTDIIIQTPYIIKSFWVNITRLPGCCKAHTIMFDRTFSISIRTNAYLL